ncbi:MAG: N-acetyltransferase [Chitinophagaceae bacterium]|nr:MAG: N-acetyltransferase [Chitinophagaceae bacterium]
MQYPTKLQTSRLLLSALSEGDVDFIFRLLNTPGWLAFIGDRKIHSADDALRYIQKILANGELQYWKVVLASSGEAVGMITLLQRDYLSHPDIGFAFLPDHAGQGLAFEAAGAVKALVLDHEQDKILHAVCLPTNTRSISLIKRLGFLFDRQARVEDETLDVYTFTLRQ